MSYMREACFISLLWILHTSFSLYIYVKLYTHTVIRVIKNLLGGVKEDGLLQLRSSLPKIPSHISFIVLEECLDFDALAKLIIWSIVLGIENISLYDWEGRIKRNQDKLLLSIHKNIKERGTLAGPCCLVWRSQADSLTVDRTVIVSKNGTMYPDVNGNGRILLNGKGKGLNGIQEGKNGIQEGRSNGIQEGSNGIRGKENEQTINISLLCSRNGKEDIASCARELSGSQRSTLITEELLGQRLTSSTHLPDPSLVVRLGLLQSNVEYPPWQLRLTEMHSIDSTRALSVQQFTDVIKRYSRCEQRFGK